MSKRVVRIPFCGVIEGEVTLRDGETETEALLRAEDTINATLNAHCKRFGRVALEGRGSGPIVGLEPV